MKRLSIDTSVLEDLEIGLDAIAYTADPAIEFMGLAFNKVKKSEYITSQKFGVSTDEVKMQIAGPIMLPKDIYRYDSKNGEYEIVFTADNIYTLTKQLMRKLPSLGVDTIFNEEHTDKKVDAYIFSVLLVDSEKEVNYIKEKYNMELPIGSSFVVTQVNDRKTYDYLVENNMIGFSVEGLFKLDEIVNEQLNKNKLKEMKKTKFTKIGSKRFKFEIEDHKELVGEKIAELVGDASLEGVTEEIEIIDVETMEEVTVKVEDGVITEIVETEVIDETALNEEEKEEVKEEVKEEELETEEVKEEVIEEEKFEMTEDMVKEIVATELQVLIDKIAELEAKLEGKEKQVEQELSDEKEDKEQKFKRAISSFITKTNKY